MLKNKHTYLKNVDYQKPVLYGKKLSEKTKKSKGDMIMVGKYDDDPFSDHSDHKDAESPPKADIPAPKAGGMPLSGDEIIAALQKNESLQESLGTENNKYIVETLVRKNNREWNYSVSVLYNGKEIRDDAPLIRDEYKRDALRDGDIEKEWNAFLKQAGDLHLNKCSKVKDRIREKELKQKEKKKLLMVKTVIIVLVLLMIGAGAYLWFFKFRPRDVKSAPAKKQAESLPVKQAEPLPVRKQPDAVPVKPSEPVPLKKEPEPLPAKESGQPPKSDEDLKKEILDRLRQ